MAPALKPGNYIVATSLARLKPGKVVVVHHDGKEKIKRIDSIQDDQVFLVGDNLGSSTDSRHFGALPKEAVIAVMIWPRLEWE